MAFIPTTPLRPFTSHQSRHRPSPHPQSPSMRSGLISTTDILILGGGPTGSCALSHLHKRRIPATLLESDPDFSVFDVTRAYALRLDFRAGRVLEQVPGLFDHLSNALQTTRGFATSTLTAHTGNKAFEVFNPKSGPPDLCDLRPALVAALKAFVTGLTGVTTRYGAELVDIHVADDGLITATARTSQGMETWKTRLLLACDGRNSRVARLLERAHNRGQPVHTSHGHGVETHISPAVGLYLKSLVFDESLINKLLGTRHPSKFLIRAMHGDPSRSFNDVFRFSIFPAGPESTRAVGGFVGTIVQHQHHNIWKLRNVEQAYDYFQDNFPQMNVRNAVSEAEMRRFVDAKPSQFGVIQRRKSLAMTTGVPGSGQGGAVVFLGDSAHAFPPDIGQGVCAAIADVGVFMDVLDNAADHASLEEIVMKYDQVRSDEGKALMRMSQIASPYQYGVYKNRLKLWAANVMFRKSLSALLPGFLWPQMASMIPEDITYREIVRRADVTTARLLGGAAAITAAVVAGIARSLLNG